MSRLRLSCGFVAAAIVVCSTPATHAQALRTWVASDGDDSSNCLRATPCRSFAGAIGKTVSGGEINVVDPGTYGSVTITKSITINGTQGPGFGTINGISTSGIRISLPADDPVRTVRLNWLDINGFFSGTDGVSIFPGNPAGLSVVIENTRIDGFPGLGIRDDRLNGGKLVISNTSVTHSFDSLIRIAAGGTNRIDATLTNVRAQNSATAGLRVSSGAKVSVKNSLFAGSGFGIIVEDANSEATVDGTTISGNSNGIYTLNGGVLRLSNSNVAFNTHDVAGTVLSHGNNRFSSNGLFGTIAPIGPVSTANGQK